VPRRSDRGEIVTQRAQPVPAEHRGPAGDRLGGGGAELCAWRLDVPPGSQGVPHTVSREEVLFVLAGTLRVTLGDAAAGERGQPGDAIVVPPGSSVRVDNPGSEPAAAWVTTTAGLEAVLPDGSRFTPPWAR